MKKITKQAAEVRDRFITGVAECRFNEVGYDLFSYTGLSAKDLEHCIAKGWADPDDCQNSSPSIGAILEFLKANPSFKAHGYVVSPDRSDVRISVEGVVADGAPRIEVDAFKEMFRLADEFEFNSNGGACRAWYD